MKVAHITPPRWCNYFPPGKYRMVLAHWARDDEDYLATMASTSPEVFVLLDNGAFEGDQVSTSELRSLAKRSGACLVALPDSPGDPTETLNRSWNALDTLSSHDVMFIPQGKTVDQWKKCLDLWMNEWGDKPTLTIGIASLRNEDGSSKYGSKLDLLKYASQFGAPMHLLGMTIPRYFLEILLPACGSYNVTGVDTSTAFALGARNILLTKEAPKHRLGDPGQYDRLSEVQRRLIFLNRLILDSWVKYGFEQVPERDVRWLAHRWLKWYSKGFVPFEEIADAFFLEEEQYDYSESRGLVTFK